MIEYTIQYDLHASAMNFFHKFRKKLIARFQVLFIRYTTDVFGRMSIFLISRCQYFTTVFYNLSIMWINIIIILYIILMVRRRDKNRVKVDHIHPQILQIIQFVPDSLNVSTIKLPDPHKCRTLIPVCNFHSRIPNVEILSVLHIIRWISIIETIHKNLIHDSTFGPFWNMKSWRNGKTAVLTYLFADSAFIIIAGQTTGLYLEPIMQWMNSKRNLCTVIIKIPVVVVIFHDYLFLVMAQINSIHVVFFGTETDRYRLSHFRLFRSYIIFCLVAEKCTWPKDRAHTKNVVLHLNQQFHFFPFQYCYLIR